MIRFCNIIFLSLFLLFLHACKNEKNSSIDTIKDIELEVEPVELNWKYLDLDLLELRKSSRFKDYTSLQKSHGTFFNLFCKRIINIGEPGSPQFEMYFKEFLTDPTIKSVFDSVNLIYADRKEFIEPLNDAFTRYKQFFPKNRIPRVETFISGFNYGIIATDSVLGIGLDMFLGKDNKFYSMLSVPKFISYSMGKEYLVSSAVKGWMTTEFVLDSKSNTLLDEMIYEGKMLYVLDALFPETHDSIKIKYSNFQLEWAKHNEAPAWKYLIDQKLLFNTNHLEKRKIIADAPFTTGMPKESPGRIGQFLGWQIVRKYMSKKDKIDLMALINETNSQKILNESGYKPK